MPGDSRLGLDVTENRGEGVDDGRSVKGVVDGTYTPGAEVSGVTRRP